MTFERVKAVLAEAVEKWRQNHTGSGEPELSTHDTAGQPPFPPLGTGCYTADELRRAFARGRQLIQDEVIGQNPPRGHEANLVVALRSGFPPRVRQMPSGGFFLGEPEIQEIEDWINAGCPE